MNTIEGLVTKTAQAENSGKLQELVADMLGKKAGEVADYSAAIGDFLRNHGQEVAAGAMPVVGAALGAGMGGKGRRMRGAIAGAGLGAAGGLAMSKIGLAALRDLAAKAGLLVPGSRARAQSAGVRAFENPLAAGLHASEKPGTPVPPERTVLAKALSRMLAASKGGGPADLAPGGGARPYEAEIR